MGVLAITVQDNLPSAEELITLIGITDQIYNRAYLVAKETGTLRDLEVKLKSPVQFIPKEDRMIVVRVGEVRSWEMIFSGYHDALILAGGVWVLAQTAKVVIESGLSIPKDIIEIYKTWREARKLRAEEVKLKVETEEIRRRLQQRPMSRLADLVVNEIPNLSAHGVNTEPINKFQESDQQVRQLLLSLEGTDEERELARERLLEPLLEIDPETVGIEDVEVR